MCQNGDSPVKCNFFCDDKKKMLTVNIATVDILTVEILMASHFVIGIGIKRGGLGAPVRKHARERVSACESNCTSLRVR